MAWKIAEGIAWGIAIYIASKTSPPIFEADFSYVWPIYAIALISYLIGSIPFGFLLTRFAGIGDLRNIGSGNIGTTNVLRTGHKGLALATLLLDFAKGMGTVLVAGIYGPDCAWIAGLSVVIGHMLPIWLKFRGGKGVATTLGVIFTLSWSIGVVVSSVWLIVFLSTRYASLSSIVAIPSSPVLLFFMLLLQRNSDLPGWLPGEPSHVSLFGVLAVLVLARHQGNIRRLLSGTESRVFLRRP